MVVSQRAQECGYLFGVSLDVLARNLLHEFVSEARDLLWKERILYWQPTGPNPPAVETTYF